MSNEMKAMSVLDLLIAHCFSLITFYEGVYCEHV